MRHPFALLNGSLMDTHMMYTRQNSGTFLQAAKFQALITIQNTTADNTKGISNNAYADCVAVKMAYKGGTYSAIIAIPEGQLDRNSQEERDIEI